MGPPLKLTIPGQVAFSESVVASFPVEVRQARPAETKSSLADREFDFWVRELGAPTAPVQGRPSLVASGGLEQPWEFPTQLMQPEDLSWFLSRLLAAPGACRRVRGMARRFRLAADLWWASSGGLVPEKAWELARGRGPDWARRSPREIRGTHDEEFWTCFDAVSPGRYLQFPVKIPRPWFELEGTLPEVVLLVAAGILEAWPPQGHDPASSGDPPPDDSEIPGTELTPRRASLLRLLAREAKLVSLRSAIVDLGLPIRALGGW